MSTNAKNSVPELESPTFFEQGYMEGRHTRENGESSFGFPRFRRGGPNPAGVDVQVHSLKVEFPLSTV
jgi:hypothetical protein